jgi:hypothetical protein
MDKKVDWPTAILDATANDKITTACQESDPSQQAHSNHFTTTVHPPLTLEYAVLWISTSNRTTHTVFSSLTLDYNVLTFLKSCTIFIFVYAIHNMYLAYSDKEFKKH